MSLVTVKFNSWIPKLLNAGATTVGDTIYIRASKTSDRSMYLLFAHEMVHVRQYRSMGGVFNFLFTYFWQWVGCGFKYSKIPLEVEAYTKQYDGLDVEAVLVWEKYFL